MGVNIMAKFEAFISTLLKHEGGFVNDPDDPGGATNKGITFATFRKYAKKLLGVEPTLQNLKRISNEQAAKIYKKKYWDKIRGDEIKDQNLANIVFDFYVNAGRNATKLLQRVINQLGGNLVIDGGIGPITIKALDKLDFKKVYMLYKKGRADYYHRICEKNPKLKKFLKGWLNRVNSFPDVEITEEEIEVPTYDLSDMSAVKVNEKGKFFTKDEEEA